MDKLNIIHSFYSKNCSEENLYIHSCYFILSCLYVNQIGGNINIRTDDKFASLIESCPYKNIYVDMNDCYNAPSDFFAYPKLLALKKEPLGTIHIDGDVFLKDSVILDLLKFNDYDCITQNLELRKFINDTLVWDKSSLYFHNIIYPYYMKRFCMKMYNCGVLGFNNEELFNEWYDNYFSMLDSVIKKPYKSTNSIPDIIIEQQSLTELCEYKKYKVKTLLPSGDFFKINSAANEIGYQHVVGYAKSDYIIMTLRKIKEISPKHYEIIKHNWYERFKIHFDNV